MGTPRPTIGDRVIVIYGDDEPEINGTRIHPAIVTRVWTPHTINVRVLTDGAAVEWLRAVPHESVADPGARRWSRQA